MKKLIFIVIVIIVFFNLYAQEIKFRGLPMDCKKNEIINLLGTPDKQFRPTNKLEIGNYRIIYNNVLLANYETELQIDFLNDRFIGAVYLIDVNEQSNLIGLQNIDNYYSCYNDFVNKLETLYGSPEVKMLLNEFQENSSILLQEKFKNELPIKTQFFYNNHQIMIVLNCSGNSYQLRVLYVADLFVQLLQKQNNSTEGL